MDLILLECVGRDEQFKKIKPITGNYEFSCSTGKNSCSSNDFELKMPYEIGDPIFEINQYVMYGDTEFGGRIGQRIIDTRKKEIKYTGYSIRGSFSQAHTFATHDFTANIVEHIEKILFEYGAILKFTEITNNASNENFHSKITQFTKHSTAFDQLVRHIDAVYNFSIKNGKIQFLIKPQKTHRFDASQVDLIIDENKNLVNTVIVYNPDKFLYATGITSTIPAGLTVIEKIIKSELETQEEIDVLLQEELDKINQILSTDIFAELQDAEIGDIVIASISEVGIKIEKKVVEKSIKIKNGNEEITYTLEG